MARPLEKATADVPATAPTEARAADEDPAVRRFPLGHLGDRLKQEVSPVRDGSPGHARKELASSSTGSSVEGPQRKGFSIASWKMRITQRAIDHKLMGDLQSTSGTEPVTETLPETSAPSSLKNEAVAVFVPPAPGVRRSARRGRATEEEELVTWLTGVFRARDVDRTERTVNALASCLQANDTQRCQELVRLATEGTLQLARESWQLLQDKELESTDGLGQPGLPLLMHRVQSLPSTNDDRLSSGSRSYRSGKATPSTDCSPCPPSPLLSTLSVSTGPAKGSSVTTPSSVSLDPEDMNLSTITVPEDTQTASSHRDDWELQFMLTGVFDDMLLRLDAGKISEAVTLLERARNRVVEWTVQRWLISRSHGGSSLLSPTQSSHSFQHSSLYQSL